MKNILLFFLLFLFMEGVFGETDDTVSVMKGDSVTLHTGLTKIPSNDVIDWSFGKNGDRIARLKNSIATYDDVLNGTFSGRLNVDNQTGDLTIRNIKTTDTGIYEVASKHTPNKRFSVTVVSIDQMQSVLVGEFVTLPTGLTDTQKYDVIRWRFGPQHSTIAEVDIKARKVSTFDSPDNRFKDRLQLTHTGSLTITNIGISHSGLYEVDIIRSSSYTIHKTFNVAVSGEVKSVQVKEGDSVTLRTDTEMHIDDLILWMFEDTVIVSQSIYGAKQQFLINIPDGIFRDSLNLDHKTGSLTITNIITEHAGDYKLQISSSRRTVNKKFIVKVKAVPDTRLFPGVIAVKCVGGVLLVAAIAAAVYYWRKFHELKEPKCDVKSVSVKVTDKVTLEPGVTKTIQKHDVILWNFEGVLIAGMTKTYDDKTYDDVLDGRFKDRLKLNNQTGSLTITDITTQHAGLYQASMLIGSNATFSSFKVAVFEKEVLVMKGDDVTLKTDTEIQGPDQVLWKFGDKDYSIAHITGWTKTAPWFNRDGKFGGRLVLDDKTGSLTITNITTEHAGLYRLQITRSRNVSSTVFSVTVSDSTASRRNGAETAILLT